MKAKWALWIALAAGLFFTWRALAPKEAISVQGTEHAVPSVVVEAPLHTPSPRPIAPHTQQTTAVSPVAKIAELEAKLKKSPQDPEALLALGLVYSHELDDLSRAVPALERAVSANTENGGALYELVGAYLDSGQGERGVAFLQSQVQLRSKNSSGLLTALADLKFNMGNIDGARVDAEQAYEQTGDSPTTSGVLGTIYKSLQDPRAEELLEKNPSEQNDQVLITTLIEKGEISEAEKRISRLTDDKSRERLSRLAEQARLAE